MVRQWEHILRRYGQTAQVCTSGECRQVRAFLQNVLDRDEQLVPSPLGLRREERVLYLGPAGVELRPRESIVRWGGADYEVCSARSVGDGHHMWAVLQRREEGA